MDPTATTTALAAPEISMIALFFEADIFVQSIMLLLVLMSVFSWGAWFNKNRQFKTLRAKAKQFEEAFWKDENLDKLYKNTKPNDIDHPLAKVFKVGIREWDRSHDSEKSGIIRISSINRVRRLMDACMTREFEKLESWLPFLATVGSTAPFIGLLGTVWGIMGSFQAIGAMNNTSLAVVAPGIAEALLATALGLFAAIPAVVAYNKLAAELGRYAGRVEAFASEFISILERQTAEENAKADAEAKKINKRKAA